MKNKNKNPFRLRTGRPEAQEMPPPKPASAMTDAELDDGLRQARREILDLQHEELRIREKARVAPKDAGLPERRPLSGIFKKKGFR
jgi:hypothetical protein